MSSLKDMNIRPIRESDVEQLDLFRREYLDAWLEIPKGFSGPGVETAVAEKGGKIIGSLTGVSAVLMDPFIHDKRASGSDIFSAVLALERVLAYKAQTGGALDSYIAVPEQATAYLEMVKRCGYSVTCERCVILRRPLVPDTVPLLENEPQAVTQETNV